MNVFEAVKANVTTNDVATMLGLKPNRSKMICCPFHDDKHPSMKVDERYYCFGCGAKGDGIDFVANYYDIGLKEAAEKIAADFGLQYDHSNYRKSDHQRLKPRLTEEQQWAIKKRELFARLSKLHEHLRQMKIKYAPKTEEDSDWSPLFCQAVNDFDYVDYLYDYCMFESTNEMLKSEYEDIVKEIEKIEQRNIDTESGAGGCPVGQVGERLAV